MYMYMYMYVEITHLIIAIAQNKKTFHVTCTFYSLVSSNSPVVDPKSTANSQVNRSAGARTLPVRPAPYQPRSARTTPAPPPPYQPSSSSPAPVRPAPYRPSSGSPAPVRPTSYQPRSSNQPPVRPAPYQPRSDFSPGIVKRLSMGFERLEANAKDTEIQLGAKGR